MKIALILFLCLVVTADDKPGPLTVTIPQDVVTLYPNGKVEYLRDVKPDDVVRGLIVMAQNNQVEIGNLRAQLSACQHPSKAESKQEPEKKK